MVILKMKSKTKKDSLVAIFKRTFPKDTTTFVKNPKGDTWASIKGKKAAEQHLSNTSINWGKQIALDNADKYPLRVRKKKHQLQHTSDMTDKKVTLTMFDHGLVDGDIITIYHNTKLVKEKIKLRSELQPIVLTLKLKRGKNTILVYCENEGSIRPNTSSIYLSNGEKIVLNASYQENGVIAFRRVKPKKQRV
jgi:hypothetical protein